MLSKMQLHLKYKCHGETSLVWIEYFIYLFQGICMLLLLLSFIKFIYHPSYGTIRGNSGWLFFEDFYLYYFPQTEIVELSSFHI